MTNQLTYDCKACGRNKKLKKIYGCNGKAQCPLEIDCVYCGGADKKCKVCKGTGFEKIYRCPVKYVYEITDFIRFFKFNRVNNLLPEQGGVLDQPNVFIDACSYLNNKIAEFENKELEKVKRTNGK